MNKISSSDENMRKHSINDLYTYCETHPSGRDKENYLDITIKMQEWCGSKRGVN